MPITINGTTVTTNMLNGTSISSETVNGTKVYGTTKVWVLIYIMSSEPQNDLGYYMSSASEPEYLAEIATVWPPNNYAVGTTAAVWDGYSYYYGYQIQEV